MSATSASNAAAFALSATSACTASTADSLSIQSLSATLSVSDTARYHKVLATALDVCRDARTANAVSALASNAALLGDARAAADANLKASKADKAATTGAFIVNQYYTYVMVGHSTPSLIFSLRSSANALSSQNRLEGKRPGLVLVVSEGQDRIFIIR